MLRGAQGGIRTGEEGGTAAILTILFTDITGSTALTERLGDDRWVQVLSAHDAVVRFVLACHGGREVKTVGDGFMAVFDRAPAAVWAGVEIQRLMRTVRVPEVAGGLQLRVGVHTGPVICRDGDVLGRTVHVARRITSAAGSGEVLVSAPVKALSGRRGALAGPPRTLSFKGVADPQVVFDMSAASGSGAEGAEGATVHVLAERRVVR